ncbi:DinB family protein, partial [Persicitalea sp.]|uniref:DinB family protein n=1 Tax=Persicitalea sp. TaxID=3100273 RepID=UPI00359373E9
MKPTEINPKPQFFDRYINLVDDLELLEALETYSPEAVFSDLETLEALGDKIYAPGKWTVKDIIQHCIDTERIMSYRALRFARNDQTPIPGFEENGYAQNTLTSQRTLDDLLDEYEIVRASTLAQFQYFNEDMLSRSGQASQVQISVGALGFMVIGHAIHHWNVIEE